MKDNLSHQQILNYTKEKVQKLFKQHPVPSHNFDHIKRVYDWAMIIAKAEKVNVFLSVMAALLHDIGRTLEKDHQDARAHHELSYELCRKWFREDEVLIHLTKEEKIILLYSVRYHWNNMADKYDVAWVLRDADKLDLFGKIYIKRAREFYKGNLKAMEKSFRLRFADYYAFHTKTARDIVEKQKLFDPVLKEYEKLLKRQIKKVKL